MKVEKKKKNEMNLNIHHRIEIENMYAPLVYNSRKKTLYIHKYYLITCYNFYGKYVCIFYL